MNHGFHFVGPTRKHEQDAISTSHQPMEKDHSANDVPSQMAHFEETAGRQRLNTV